MRVLEHFCSFEMCLDIKYFVQHETQFFEHFGIKENRAFGRHFTCEFGCHGMCWQNNDIAEKMWLQYCHPPHITPFLFFKAKEVEL